LPRADALRNRERVLTAAREAFATEGPAVSLDDIARRAGVGAGTVHRHFPTKDELVRAVLADRLRELTVEAQGLAEAADPGPAFFGFFGLLADHARQNLTLAAALASRTEVGEAVREAGAALEAALGVLLDRAQQAGAVRPDLGTGDLHAIVAGTLAMEQRLPPESRGRGLAVVTAGLRA
jgi:AcrR family transcriptional regulator